MSDERTRLLDRRSVLAASGSIAVTGLAGCQRGGGQSSDTVKIGLLAPSPGNNPAGTGMEEGAQMAVDRINENGGILDADVELIVEDTESSAQPAREAYQTLTLDEEVDFTTGVVSAEVLMTLIDEIANQETLHLTTGALIPRVGEMVNEDYETYKYHFRSSLNGMFLGRATTDFIAQQFPAYGWENVALIAEDTEDGVGLLNGISDAIGGIDNVSVVMDTAFSPGTQNFSPLYDQAEENGADVLLPIMVMPGSTAAVVQWANSQRPFAFAGLHVPSQSPGFYQQTDGAAAHTVSINPATPEVEYNDKTQPFISDYRDRFGGTPIFSAFTTYSGVQMFAEAASEAGSLETGEMIPTLESLSYSSVQGLMEFHGRDAPFTHDMKYQIGESPPVFHQWQPADDSESGTQEVIFPPQFQTAEYQPASWRS